MPEQKEPLLAEQGAGQEQEEGIAMEDDDVSLSSIEAEQHSDLSSNDSQMSPPVDRAANYVGDVAESQISTQPIPIGTQDSEPPQSQITHDPAHPRWYSGQRVITITHSYKAVRRLVRATPTHEPSYGTTLGE